MGLLLCLEGLADFWTSGHCGSVSTMDAHFISAYRLAYNPNKQVSKDSLSGFHDDTVVCMFIRVGWISAADGSCWIWSNSQHSLDPWRRCCCLLQSLKGKRIPNVLILVHFHSFFCLLISRKAVFIRDAQYCTKNIDRYGWKWCNFYCSDKEMKSDI